MNPIVAFIKLIRFPNLVIIALTQYAIRFGIIQPFLFRFSGDQTINGVGLKMTELYFFLLSLSTVMIAAAGYIINDYFDLKIDRVNRPDKIIIGKYIKRRMAMGAHVVINIMAILLAAYVAYKVGNFKLILIQIITVGALWYYSVTFKKQVLIGNIMVAILAALVPLVAGVYELMFQHLHADDTVNTLLFYLDPGTPFDDVMYAFNQLLINMLKWVGGFSLFAFLSTMVREIIKDIEDYEGDKKYFSNTLSVMYGKKKGKIVAQLIALIMVGLIAYLQSKQLVDKDMTSFMYFLFAIQIPLLFIVFQLQKANKKSDYSKLSKYMKLIMLSGVLYTAVFYYSIVFNV